MIDDIKLRTHLVNVLRTVFTSSLHRDILILVKVDSRRRTSEQFSENANINVKKKSKTLRTAATIL